MKIKISTVDGKHSYSYRNDLDEYEGYEGEELRPLNSFDISNINQYNGNHFIFGWWECFTQSDEIPYWMRENELVLEFTNE